MHESARQRSIVVQHVDAVEMDPARRVAGCQRVESGLLLAARPAPGGPEDEHRFALMEIDGESGSLERFGRKRRSRRPDSTVGRRLGNVRLERAAAQQQRGCQEDGGAS